MLQAVWELVTAEWLWYLVAYNLLRYLAKSR